MSTQEVDHSTPAKSKFSVAVTAVKHGLAARREAWPITSRMIWRVSPEASCLYVINDAGFAVGLSTEDHTASDWIIYDPLHKRPAQEN